MCRPIRLPSAVLLSLACWTLPGPVKTADIEHVLRSCAAVVAGVLVVDVRAIDIPSAGLPCCYHLSAIQNMSVLIDANGRPLRGICAPTNTSVLDDVRICIKVAHDHSAVHEGNAAAVILAALTNRYPSGLESSVLLSLLALRTFDQHPVVRQSCGPSAKPVTLHVHDGSTKPLILCFRNQHRRARAANILAIWELAPSAQRERPSMNALYHRSA
jgi:hypothetical protein